MYVARRELKVIDRNDNVTMYKPGDVIPDFATWPEVPRRAHLNMNYVEQVQDAPKKTKAPKETVLPVSQHQQPVAAPTQAPQPEAEPAILKCALCGDSSKPFKSQKGLNSHVKIVHSK